jgi:hypothetical protein
LIRLLFAYQSIYFYGFKANFYPKSFQLRQNLALIFTFRGEFYDISKTKHAMMILSIVIVSGGIGIVIWQQILENKRNSAKGNF